MAKRRNLKNVRPKALFGLLESASNITAAGIQAGATLTAAGIQAAAQAAAAERQAESIEDQATRNAEALQQRNENDNRLQEKNVQLQQETTNKIADSISATQMNLERIAANESKKERDAEGRAMVKRGGNIKKRMRNGGYNPTVPLTGGYNMPFEVTDGGGVAYQGSTPEGYDLYEILGDNHEHRHKTRGGKYKTGVGFKFANGGIVEGEGNQSTGQGEYLLVTPDNGYFISKHTINGVNPAGLINQGIHPVDAYNIQEAAKGRKTSFAKRLRCGGRVKARLGDFIPYRYTTYYDNENIAPFLQPDLYESDIVRSQAIAAQNNRPYVPNASQVFVPRQNYNVPSSSAFNPSVGASIPDVNIRGGGDNASVGGWTMGKDLLKVPQLTNPNTGVPRTVGTGDTSSSKSNFWNSPNGALAINTGVNFLGAGIQHIGNLMGQHKLSNAYNRAANIMTEAYNNLKQIDPDSLGLNDLNQWRSAHYLPAIRSANVNVNPQLQDINRTSLRQQQAINNNTLSSAARLNRNASVEQTAQENRSKVYADQANREEDIKQKNNEMINQAAAANIQASNQLRQSLANIRADIAKYNNDIKNKGTLGAADVQSQMAINEAATKADAYNATADAYSSALTTSGNNYYNAWQTAYKSDMDYLNSLALGTPGAQVNSLLYRKSAGYNIDPRYIKIVYASASPEERVRLRQGFPDIKFG